jgi:two-component system sensor histidine kinase ChiS
MTSQARILVVDDEPDTLGLIELTLQTADYEVQSALNAKLALQKLRHDRFDLLLLDIMMPDMSGFDIIRTLQAEKHPYPPVIFLTAKNQPEDREIAEKLGAAAFLTKPTTRGQLLDAVELALTASS